MKLKMYEILQLKSKELNSWKKFTGWGLALFILGLLELILLATGELTAGDDVPLEGAGLVVYWVLYGAMCLAGICLYISGLKRKAMSKRYTDYLTHFIGQRSMSFTQLAERTHVPIDTVRLDITQMILKNYLPGARLDDAFQEILFYEEGEEADEGETPDGMVVVECPNCTAVNTVKSGNVCVCEYCGQKIGG